MALSTVNSSLALLFSLPIADPCEICCCRAGMLFLGPLVMESLLFPNLERYYRRLEPALSSSNPNLVERLEAQNCLGILVVRLFTRCCMRPMVADPPYRRVPIIQHASGTYFSMSKSMDRGASPSLSPSALGDIVTLLYDAFGESLLPYIRPEQPTSMLDLCL